LAVPEQGVRVHSEFSHIVVREVGTVRTLYFVSEDGREHIESQMDIARPEQLLLPYARAMFASYLFVPEPHRVLLIGIGAGSMIRFLEHYDARVDVDGVDIDPVVVDVARDYFGTRPSAHVRLLVRDGFDHVETTEERYDVIYLDAFLKPVPDARAVDTDISGVPRRLKTIETYRKMQDKLAPGGVVVVNLHYKTLDEDVETLREAFAQEALFEVPGTGNYVLVGSGAATLPSREALRAVGARVDQRLGADFSIAELSSQLREE
jgi:spermidine synthase